MVGKERVPFHPCTSWPRSCNKEFPSNWDQKSSSSNKCLEHFLLSDFFLCQFTNISIRCPYIYMIKQIFVHFLFFLRFEFLLLFSLSLSLVSSTEKVFFSKNTCYVVTKSLWTYTIGTKIFDLCGWILLLRRPREITGNVVGLKLN